MLVGALTPIRGINALNVAGLLVLGAIRGGIPDPLPGGDPLPGFREAFLILAGTLTLVLGGAGPGQSTSFWPAGSPRGSGFHRTRHPVARAASGGRRAGLRRESINRSCPGRPCTGRGRSGSSNSGRPLWQEGVPGRAGDSAVPAFGRAVGRFA